ncbi:hypothetical protein D6825_01285, partial [Candidatus Woesearchaeota archaeon]
EEEYNPNLHHLLTKSIKTVEANIQYLSHLGIKKLNTVLLRVNPRTKRKKIAWVMRELFDYHRQPVRNKRETIKKAYALVRDKPSLLIKSISSLEKEKQDLAQLAMKYK